MAAVELPIASVPPSGSDRVRSGGTVAVTNLVPRAPGPHLLFIALRDRGPPALLGLDAPDQGVGQGPNEPLGPLVERST